MINYTIKNVDPEKKIEICVEAGEEDKIERLAVIEAVKKRQDLRGANLDNASLPVSKSVRGGSHQCHTVGCPSLQYRFLRGKFTRCKSAGCNCSPGRISLE